MLKVGITGGIGAGKSVVCRIFSFFGIPVFDADLEAKKILSKNLSVQDKIKATFGNEVFKENGELNRNKLADIVFNDNDLLKKLNIIVHPYVKECFSDWIKLQNSPYAIKEAAILYESGTEKLLDKTIMVYCEKDKRIERIIKRNGFTLGKIEKIIESQMSDEEKCKKADFIIYNNEKTLLLPQIIEIHNKLLSL